MVFLLLGMRCPHDDDSSDCELLYAGEEALLVPESPPALCKLDLNHPACSDIYANPTSKYVN